MIELWLVVSTVCFWSPHELLLEKSHTFWDGSEGRVLVQNPVCVQEVSVSTSQPTPKAGEMVYRVVPATATICEVCGHDWNGKVPLEREFFHVECEALAEFQ